MVQYIPCDSRGRSLIAGLAYYPDGQALLAELGQLGPQQTYFRTHNLLTTCDPPDDVSARLKWGCTNAYTEDANGNPLYNWTIIDRIFDTYLERGVKPYAQISFMPKALATDPDPYTFVFDATSSYNVIYTGWSHVPTSWQKWGELVYQWVKHEVELRGEDEVNSWYWEVWNEVCMCRLALLSILLTRPSPTSATGMEPRRSILSCMTSLFLTSDVLSQQPELVALKSQAVQVASSCHYS